MCELIQQLVTENARLQEENQFFRAKVDELTTTCADLQTQVNNVQLQLAQVLAAPRLRQSLRNLHKEWHQQANLSIGAQNSQTASNNFYSCVHHHEGCNWTHKKVTLQAYMLHLQRKHGEKMSDNPDLSLLPMLPR